MNIKVNKGLDRSDETFQTFKEIMIDQQTNRPTNKTTEEHEGS